MVGKWHFSSATESWPLDRGFERFFGFLGGQHDYYQPNIGETMHGVGCSSDAFIFDQKDPVRSVKFLTDEFTDRAIDFMGQSAGQPFFLYLAYNAPHPPMRVPWEYLEKYAAKRAKENLPTATSPRLPSRTSTRTSAGCAPGSLKRPAEKTR